jgi:predicted phosphohydrolase
MTTIQIVSDTHLEFTPDFRVTHTGADVLVLAGDICPAGYWPQQKAFFEDCAANYPLVLYVTGNHEYYGAEFPRVDQSLVEYLAYLPNVQVLYNMPFVYNDITFVGSTLWTDLDNLDPLVYQQAVNYMRDYQNIYRDIANRHTITPTDTYNKFLDDFEFIDGCVTEAQTNNVVVITHHAPSSMSVPPKYRGGVYSSINPLFYTDLSEFILDNPKIKLWIHGHMHEAAAYEIGNTQVVVNPFGYPYEPTNFNPTLVLTV